MRKLLASTLAATVMIPAGSADAKKFNRWKVVAPYNAKLKRIANCESGGRWGINTGNGFYGGLQFTLGTWRSVGGRGYPHSASRMEQKFRAVKLIRREGFAPWPVCGRA